MKTTKLFFMAALALTFAACSNDDNDLAQQPAEQPANDEITITATVSSDDGATTRALSIDGDNIASTWETNDEFAILFNDGSSNVKRIATVVTPISGSTVTITFTIPSSLASDTPCTIVYPASAANAANTGADVATALATTQDGTIENCPEVRVGTATIDKDNHSLSSVTKLAAQNAIFKFTTKNSNGSATIDVTSLTITIGAQNYVITPALATSELFAALPAVSGQAVTFTATDGSNLYAASKASVTFAAGKYYQSNIKMAPALNLTNPTVGQVIGNDGKNYDYASLPGGVTAVAKICYVSGSNGLALALTDESSSGMNWDTAKTTCAAHTPAFTGGTWKLATQDEWNNMITAAGSYDALRTGFDGITGASNLQPGMYWSNTEYEGDSTKAYVLVFSNGHWNGLPKTMNVPRVRACLAF